MINVNQIRHPKEKQYFTIMAIFGVIVWIPCFVLLISLILLSLIFIPIAWLIGWFAYQKFKARLYGNSVEISKSQYPEIYEIIERGSAQMGIKVPKAFVISSGDLNAFIQRAFGRNYVMLHSELIDLLRQSENLEELTVIIGHELGHQAASEGLFKRLLIMPARILPFIGGAYARARELTCDRCGCALVGNSEVAKRALSALALGSKRLKSTISLDAFMKQENEISSIGSIMTKLYSTHPRHTIRVIEMDKFGKEFNM